MTLASMRTNPGRDLVAAQAEDVFEEIEGISGDILIIDTPGQVELFAFREASNHLVQVLGREWPALFSSSIRCFPRPKWIRIQMLLSSIVHLDLVCARISRHI